MWYKNTLYAIHFWNWCIYSLKLKHGMNLPICYCHCPMFVSIYSRDRHIDELHQTIIKANTDNVMKGRNKALFYFTQPIRVNLAHVCWMFKVMQNLFPNSTQRDAVCFVCITFSSVSIYVTEHNVSLFYQWVTTQSRHIGKCHTQFAIVVVVFVVAYTQRVVCFEMGTVVVQDLHIWIISHSI